MFAGHGLRALEEAGAVAATPFGERAFPALGFYPTWETFTAQLLVLVLIAAGFLFGNARKSA